MSLPLMILIGWGTIISLLGIHALMADLEGRTSARLIVATVSWLVIATALFLFMGLGYSDF